MEDFLKMDIFFVVTTAVAFAVGVFVLAMLYYIGRILRSIDHILENVSRESDSVRGDIAVLRKKIADEGVKLRHFSDFFEEVILRKTRMKRKKHEEAE